jgi:dihydrofolate synthase/folylpolyglutamate synthase
MALMAFMEAKGEAYSRIDPERIQALWREKHPRFHLKPIIHLVGTNGKGSTGRALAKYLHHRGLSVGHYSSPHLLRFNERFWLNGTDIDDEALEQAHEELMHRTGPLWAEALSYFEYATLLAAVLFESCDAVVMEAGLGGEFDATTVFDARLLLITPIDYDHQAFLGDRIEAIATTKLRAIRCESILGHQSHPQVTPIATAIAADHSFKLHHAANLAPPLEAFRGPKEPHFHAINRQLAFAAATRLGYQPRPSDFNATPLPGRLQQIAANVWIDVGHNRAAAEAICEFFKDRPIHIIYNSYQDKDYESIIGLLSSITRSLLYLPIDSARAAPRREIERVCSQNGVEFGQFESLRPDRDYLVFGSFGTVEAFLKGVDAR